MTISDSKPFAVLYWGSHPDDGNDDCHSGTDFDTLEAAEAAFIAPVPKFYLAFIELTGPDGLRRIRQNPAYDAKKVARERALDEAEWRREAAREAGMLGGVKAYNEVMGYD